MVLNFVFLVHSGFALVVALLLFFYTDWFTQMVTGVTWTPGPMADLAELYARFSAVGLVLVFVGTTFARISAYTNVRMVALQSMMIISAFALVVSYFVPFNPLQTLSLIVNLLLIVAYGLILYFNYDEI